MVILLHREDAYEKESPRAGEADFIVAKHRNGPTDTIDRGVPGPLQPVHQHGPEFLGGSSSFSATVVSRCVDCRS